MLQMCFNKEIRVRILIFVSPFGMGDLYKVVISLIYLAGTIIHMYLLNIEN